MRAVLFIIFLSVASIAFAQQSPQIRRLPPSLERELKLKHGGKVRIIGFTDTLKAQNLIAQSLRDTSGGEELDSLNTRDTAIIMIDSAVSLTDKEWLDSMMAELPEFERTPEGIRFHYPADVLIETNRKVVPPDTTLSSKMDPVSKEDLPIYGNLPMPKPLEKISLPRTSVELGAGAPYIPRIDLHSLVFSNEVSAIEADGKFFSTSASEPAIKEYWKLGVTGSFAFADPLISSGEQVPQLDINATTGANRRMLAGNAPTLSLTNLDAGFIIGSPSQLKLRTNASLSFLNDNYTPGISETKEGFDILASKNFSLFLAEVGFRYETVSEIVGVSVIELRTIAESRDSGSFQWNTGLLYLFGNNVGKGLLLSPVINIRTHLSHSLEIGAGFEPENKLISLRELYAENLFYSPRSVLASLVFEPLHFNMFSNYFFSLDKEVHAAIRYITRNNEPIFFLNSDSGKNIFTANLLNTRRIQFEAGGSTKLFGKDKLRGSILFQSVSDRDSSISLPYIPTTQIQASYQFGIWDKFIPEIELMNLERTNHSFTFINLDAKYIFSPAFELKFRAENIFGNAGDFWTGYNEYPRSVWVSGKYAF